MGFFSSSATGQSTIKTCMNIIKIKMSSDLQAEKESNKEILSKKKTLVR